MAKFELVSKFAAHPELLPSRATAASAGYDFFVAEDTLVPSYFYQMEYLKTCKDPGMYNENAMTLDEISALTKQTGIKPTLVSTGVKCKLREDLFLQLSVRSSCPLKNWLILANGVGIIDADYYNNPDNEGEIFVQLINLSPYDIQLKAGDRIAQGIIIPYNKVYNDSACGDRSGGLGSTS